MAEHEAVFVPIKCVENKRNFYARYDYAYDGVWVLTYGIQSLPSDSSGSQAENAMTKMDLSNQRTGPQYKCPYCKNRGYVKCGRCGKLTCWALNTKTFLCAHCGNSGEVSGYISSLEGDTRQAQR